MREKAAFCIQPACNSCHFCELLAKQLYLEGELSVSEICEQLSISKGTLYNYLHQQGVKTGKKSS